METYAEDFYVAENIVGYTGEIGKKPTIYFERVEADKSITFGHITQDHGDKANIGREKLQNSANYEHGNHWVSEISKNNWLLLKDFRGKEKKGSIAEGFGMKEIIGEDGTERVFEKTHVEFVDGMVVHASRGEFIPVNDENRTALSAVLTKENMKGVKVKYTEAYKTAQSKKMTKDVDAILSMENKNQPEVPEKGVAPTNKADSVPKMTAQELDVNKTQLDKVEAKVKKEKFVKYNRNKVSDATNLQIKVSSTPKVKTALKPEEDFLANLSSAPRLAKKRTNTTKKVTSHIEVSSRPKVKKATTTPHIKVSSSTPKDQGGMLNKAVLKDFSTPQVKAENLNILSSTTAKAKQQKRKVQQRKSDPTIAPTTPQKSKRF